MEVLVRNCLLVYLCLWLGSMSFDIWALYTVLLCVSHFLGWLILIAYSSLRNSRGFDNTLILAAQNSPALPAGTYVPSSSFRWGLVLRAV